MKYGPNILCGALHGSSHLHLWTINTRCVYTMQTQEIFSPEIHADNECFTPLFRNPVVGARSSIYGSDVIKHVLGWIRTTTGLTVTLLPTMEQ